VPEQHFWFAKLLNDLFGGLVAALMSKAGIPPANPHYPIPDYVGGEILVLLIIVAVTIVLRSRLSVENPGKLQHAMEIFLEFTQNLADEMIGHGARRYVPLIGTLGLFIVICNIIGLIPTFVTPTASVQVPVGCAVIVFIHYNYHGFRVKGIFGYLRHMAGPMVVIAPLFFLVEVFSSFFRMVSLTARLWGNMNASVMVPGIFISLGLKFYDFLTHAGWWQLLSPIGIAIVAIAFPLAFLVLHIIEAALQAYVFMILPAVYISLAISEEH
jgi:F-type H+-transporting ATPase subunit a